MPLMCLRSKLEDAESQPALHGLNAGFLQLFLAFPKFIERLLLARNCSLSCKN
jgi:hypothetical protein